MKKLEPRDRVLTWLLPSLPALTALALLVLVLSSSERIVGEELRLRAGSRVEQSAQLYSDQLSRSLARRASEVELLGEMARTTISKEAWRDQMQRLKASSPAFVWIGVTDNLGTVEVATDGLLEGMSIATRGVFANGKDGLWFGTLHPPVALREPLRNYGLPVPAELADIAMPIVDLQGQPKGVIATHLDARYFEGQRLDVLGPLEARRVLTMALVDADGRVLVGERPDVSESEWRALLAGPEESSRSVADGKGETHIVSRSAVEPRDSKLRTPWHVVASQPVSAALAPVRQLERSLLVWGGATTLLLGLAGFAVSRYLSRRVTGLRADGQVLDLEASISQISFRGHKLLTAILRDVTERVRAERALTQYQLELSELTRRLLMQEKQTTRRLAQTLHDQLGQTLGAMRLSFDALLGLIPPDMPPKARERGRTLGQLIDTANAEVRQALVLLRPPLLDEAGLQAALESGHRGHARARQCHWCAAAG